MKAIVSADIEPAKPKIKKSTILLIKQIDPKCQKCSKNMNDCEGKCTSFWARNKLLLTSREERRRRIKRVR